MPSTRQKKPAKGATTPQRAPRSGRDSERTGIRRTTKAAPSQPAPFARDDLTEASHSAAGRALAVLQAVSATERALSAVELSPLLGIPKPTAHRLMLLLESIGFLEREPGSKRFIAGRALTRMAVDTLIFSPGRAIRHSVLQALVDEVEETCNITMLAGDQIVYVDRVEAHWPLRYQLHSGSRVPMHCSASGRLFLSYLPARKRRAILRAVPLKKYTEHTIVDPDEIEKALKKIRAAEVSLDIEEFMDGLIGVAVPVFDSRRRLCATVSMHAPSIRCTPEQALDVVPALTHAAKAVGATLTADDRA